MLSYSCSISNPSSSYSGIGSASDYLARDYPMLLADDRRLFKLAAFSSDSPVSAFGGDLMVETFISCPYCLNARNTASIILGLSVIVA